MLRRCHKFDVVLQQIHTHEMHTAAQIQFTIHVGSSSQIKESEENMTQNIFAGIDKTLGS